jgi:hypothetical protein
VLKVQKNLLLIDFDHINHNVIYLRYFSLFIQKKTIHLKFSISLFDFIIDEKTLSQNFLMIFFLLNIFNQAYVKNFIV